VGGCIVAGMEEVETKENCRGADGAEAKAVGEMPSGHGVDVLPWPTEALAMLWK